MDEDVRSGKHKMDTRLLGVALASTLASGAAFVAAPPGADAAYYCNTYRGHPHGCDRRPSSATHLDLPGGPWHGPGASPCVYDSGQDQSGYADIAGYSQADLDSGVGPPGISVKQAQGYGQWVAENIYGGDTIFNSNSVMAGVWNGVATGHYGWIHGYQRGC